MPRFVSLAAAITSVACGGTSVNGTVSGQKLTGSHALFVLGGGIPTVVISDQSDVCDQLQQNYERANEDYVQVQLYDVNSTGSVVANSTGKYSVAYVTTDAGGNTVWQPTSEGLLARVYADKLDSACAALVGQTDPTKGFGFSGSVTISKLDTSSKGSIEGSFAAKIGPQGDVLSGSFDAVYCDFDYRLTAGTPSCR